MSFIMSKGEISEQQKTATQWPDMVGQLFNRLTGKEAVISLEVEIPQQQDQADRVWVARNGYLMEI